MTVQASTFNLFNRHKMVHHSSSLAGREFRTVIQAAPFVFFNHLSRKERSLWLLLGRLCSYVFQTVILDMKVYLAELNVAVHCFLHHLISMTGQWTNKPKFHMLTHLVDSVERFGPPSLVSSERFESHNGVTRAASVHSNHLSPGRDIATSRNNERLLRALLSGATLQDSELRTHTRAGPAVRQLFLDKPHIQQMFGWNAKWAEKELLQINCKFRQPTPFETPHNIPFLLVPPKTKSTPSVVAPPCLTNTWKHMRTWAPILNISLPRAGQVKIGDFVMV